MLPNRPICRWFGSINADNHMMMVLVGLLFNGNKIAA
jgi:hypothetical protein